MDDVKAPCQYFWWMRSWWCRSRWRSLLPKRWRRWCWSLSRSRAIKILHVLRSYSSEKLAHLILCHIIIKNCVMLQFLHYNKVLISMKRFSSIYTFTSSTSTRGLRSKNGHRERGTVPHFFRERSIRFVPTIENSFSKSVPERTTFLDPCSIIQTFRKLCDYGSEVLLPYTRYFIRP